jgi:hypothetical protein
MNQPRCVVCGDTGWSSSTRTIEGQTYSWAAACLCERGMRLSSTRDPHPKSGERAPRPVVVQPMDRELYLQRAAAAKRRDGERRSDRSSLLQERTRCRDPGPSRWFPGVRPPSIAARKWSRSWLPPW